MARAECLVDLESDELKLNESGLKEIERIPEGYGIITEAIVGPGRIGKSSLLNWLVGKDVFQTGSTTIRVTKGIWIYVAINHEHKLANMYIDVEGFADPKKDNATETDQKLLIITLQLCDVVMYNIKGVYDSEMRDKLQFVCSLFKTYRKENKVLSKPILVAVHRDFTLDPPESPDQELIDLFKDRKSVFETFREIKAFHLVQPVDVKMKEFCAKFIDGKNTIEEYLTKSAEPLRAASNKCITGKVLAESLRKTVKLVNDEDLTFVSKTYEDTFKEQNEKTIKAAIETYEENMKKHWPSTSDPESLSRKHSEYKDDAMNEVKRKVFIIDSSWEPDQENIMEKIESVFKRLSMNRCDDARKEACMQIQRNIEDEKYSTVGGYDEFRKDLSQAEKDYKRHNNLGSTKDEVWENYKERIAENEKLIKTTAKVKKQEMEATKAKAEAEREKIKLQCEKNRLALKEKEIQEKEQEGSTMRKFVDYGLTALDAVKAGTAFVSSVKSYGSTLANHTSIGKSESSSKSDFLGDYAPNPSSLSTGFPGGFAPTPLSQSTGFPGGSTSSPSFQILGSGGTAPNPSSMSTGFLGGFGINPSGRSTGFPGGFGINPSDRSTDFSGGCGINPSGRSTGQGGYYASKP